MENPIRVLPYYLVLAMSSNNGIGFQGAVPWKLPMDLAYFRYVTSECFLNNNSTTSVGLTYTKQNRVCLIAPHNSGKNIKNMVVMGRKTWDSIPAKARPLSKRLNVVLSKNENFLRNNPYIENEFYAVNNIDEVFTIGRELKRRKILNEIFLIGGAQIFSEFLTKYNNQCHAIFLTYIYESYQCDTFFKIPDYFQTKFISKKYQENNTHFDFRLLINQQFSNNEEFISLLIKRYFLKFLENNKLKITSLQ